MADVTTWAGLREFVAEQERIDLDRMSRGDLIAMSYRLNDVIQAQFLPPIFTFLRLCNLYARVAARIKAKPVEYTKPFRRSADWRL